MKNNLKEIKKEYFNWPILIVVSTASIIAGSYRDGFAALFPFLQSNFNLTRAQVGFHSTIFFFTSAVFGLFTGRLVDIKGSKWSLFFGTFLMGIFILLHSIAPNFILLLLFTSFTGVSVSINSPATNKSIIEWFSDGWKATALGILSTAYPMGGILAATILPFFGNLFGWRRAILIPGVLSILYAFFISFFHQNKEQTNDKHANKQENFSIPKYIKQIIKNYELLNVSILGFFFGAASGSIAAHFTLYLYTDYSLSKRVSGLGFAMVQFGSMIGRPLWGLICDRLIGSCKKKTFLYIGFLFTSLCIILGFFSKIINPSLYIIFVLAFFTGFIGRGWQGLYFVSIAEIARVEQVGISIGYSLLFIRIGIMVAPPIFGYIADLNGTYSLSWALMGITIFLITLANSFL